MNKAVLATISCSVVPLAPLAAERPNILFIMSDDQGAHAMSCYGSKINSTPNMDAIAKNGVRCNRVYATNPICAPSRACILSGMCSHKKGVVTNVTAFGAFVDIGIHQDGLVHVSELANRFIRDPSEVVKTGDKIKVRVLAVDKARNRVSLTCRSGTSAPRQYAGGPRPQSGAGRGGSSRGGGRSYSSSVCNANRGKIEGLDNEENLLAVGPRMRRSCLEVSGLFPMVSVA